MNWTRLLRMAPQEVVGKVNGNQIVVVRGPNSVLLLRLDADGEYKLELDLPNQSIARQLTYLGAEHIFAVLDDGVILILKEV